MTSILRSRTGRAILLLHVALIAIQVWLLYDIGRSSSPTVDAPHHLAVGVMTLASGDVRFCFDDPPLQNCLNALPVLACFEPALPFESQAWLKADSLQSLAKAFMEANREDYLRMFAIARWGTILLSVVTALLLYWWAYFRLGPLPALLAQILFTFEPNLLAHGCLVTTDMGAVVTILAAAIAFDCFVHCPSWPRFGLAACLFGLAWLAKHAAVVMLPVFLIVVVLSPPACHWLGVSRNALSPVRALRAVLLFFVLSYLVIWAGYGFEIGSIRLASADIETMEQASPEISASTGILERYLPAYTHFEGLLRQREHAASGHITWFLGRLRYSGSWLYYPVLFCVKSTAAFLALWVIGTALIVRNLQRRDYRMSVVWLTPLVYLAVLMCFNRATIGYRHALPVLPFFCLWAAWGVREILIPRIATLPRLVAVLRRNHPLRIRVVFLCVLLVAHVISTLYVHPYEITYFNEPAGGPASALVWATDSNADWGQALLSLSEFVRENGYSKEKPLPLFYFGPPELLEIYDIPMVLPAPSDLMRPGYVAVSLTALSGVGFPAYNPFFEQLRQHEPVHRLGNAIYVYEIGGSAGKRAN